MYQRKQKAEQIILILYCSQWRQREKKNTNYCWLHEFLKQSKVNLTPIQRKRDLSASPLTLIQQRSWRCLKVVVRKCFCTRTQRVTIYMNIYIYYQWKKYSGSTWLLQLSARAMSLQFFFFFLFHLSWVSMNKHKKRMKNLHGRTQRSQIATYLESVSTYCKYGCLADWLVFSPDRCQLP